MTEADFSERRLHGMGVPSLVALLPRCTQLTSLDLTANNPGVEAGFAIMIATAMSTNGTVKSLNLSANEIGAQNTATGMIHDNDGPGSMYAMLQHNTMLTSLDVSNNRFSSEIVQALHDLCASRSVALNAEQQLALGQANAWM